MFVKCHFIYTITKENDQTCPSPALTMVDDSYSTLTPIILCEFGFRFKLYSRFGFGSLSGAVHTTYTLSCRCLSRVCEAERITDNHIIT